MDPLHAPPAQDNDADSVISDGDDEVHQPDPAYDAMVEAMIGNGILGSFEAPQNIAANFDYVLGLHHPETSGIHMGPATHLVNVPHETAKGGLLQLNVLAPNYGLSPVDRRRLRLRYPSIRKILCGALNDMDNPNAVNPYCTHSHYLCHVHGHQVVGNSGGRYGVVLRGPNVDPAELVLLLMIRLAGEGDDDSVAKFTQRAIETNDLRLQLERATDRLDERGIDTEELIHALPETDLDRKEWMRVRTLLTGRIPYESGITNPRGPYYNAGNHPNQAFPYYFGWELEANPAHPGTGGVGGGD